MSVLRRAWFPVVLLGVGLAVRAVQARGALLYPDGYQYLLMARGIAEHLRPVLELGQGGDVFVPNADASAKPLFPALIALVHAAGPSWRTAAEAVSVAGGGAAVALCGLLGARISGSRVAGAAAALLLLLAPEARHWAAFTSPDPLGQALALGAVLAVLTARPRLAGVLAGLAACARPELGVLLLAAGAAFAIQPARRAQALRFVSAGCFAVAAVVVVLRPPLVFQPILLVGGAAAIAFAALGVLARPRVAVLVGLGTVVAASLRSPALVDLGTHGSAPVLVLGVAGIVVARRTRPAALLAATAGVLALLYAAKNGGNDRYAAELLPLATLGASLAFAAVPRPRLAVAAAGAAVTVLAFAAVPAPPARDAFLTVANQLPDSNRPLVTAAADAYGFLLYPRPVRWLRPGARGLVLLDGAARAYEPGAKVRGPVVARFGTGYGFLRPDGRIDRAPALLFVR
jgi:hypothetical protein